MKYIQVPSALKATSINAYSEDAFEAKEAFHTEGKKFLRKLAEVLGLAPGQFDIRSNKGGMAVSGEVTLHADNLYVQLYESCTSRGVSVLYRTCEGRKDYVGGQNHHASIESFCGREKQQLMVERMARLAGTVPV